jgi:3-phenylpropionate/trans-cinnamate dioxygenase ferredoxin subunit
VPEVRVCSAGDVKAGGAVRFEVVGHRLCVVKIDEHWYVIGDRCSHGAYSLSEGEVYGDDREIECPAHGSIFSLETGEPKSLPATKPVPAYVVTIDGDDVIVTLP